MLNVYVRERRRRKWSFAAISVSVCAHLLLLAGALSAMPPPPSPPEPDPEPEQPPVVWVDIADQPPRDEPAAPSPPAPEETPETALGGPRKPDDVRTPPPDPPSREPSRPFNSSEHEQLGLRSGNPAVENPPAAPGASGGTPAPPAEPESLVPIELVEEQPLLANEDEAERLLRQHYPPLLREAGVTGRTTVLMIIDAEGRVEPGSVSVQETTHRGFRDPAIKVAEKLRFRPARMDGRSVAVIIAVPIAWRLDY